jgi:hypothetical protein
MSSKSHYDAKKELESLPRDFAVLDAPCDSHDIGKTRKGVIPQ